jgi:GNAT superfamily N-acetyltransferase
MSKQLSIRLDDNVHRELETAARAQGVGIATYLRDLAANQAKQVRRLRIRAESARVGALYAAGQPEAREFYDAWGAPDPDACG